MKNIVIPFTLISVVFLHACSADKKDGAAKMTAIPVVVDVVQQNSNNRFVTASGKVEAEHSANLSTRMMGYVTRLNVKVGDAVAAGQLLVSINSADLQAKKAQVDAAILQATAAYNNAKKDHDRFVNLYNQQSASQKELDDMTARYEMARAALEGAKQMRNEVMAQFSYSNITAPFSGTVTGTFVKEGDMASPGMPLVTVEGASELQVMAMVSESDITAVRPGMPVKVTVKSLDRQYDGKVQEVSMSAKNTGGQYLVKITLGETEDVLPGMFVNVQFPVENTTAGDVVPPAILVPEGAIIHQGQLNGIYVFDDQKNAILRWLRLGREYGGQVEVLSGLSAGEQYIVSADGKLYNGAKVSF